MGKDEPQDCSHLSPAMLVVIFSRKNVGKLIDFVFPHLIITYIDEILFLEKAVLTGKWTN